MTTRITGSSTQSQYIPPLENVEDVNFSIGPSQNNNNNNNVSPSNISQGKEEVEEDNNLEAVLKQFGIDLNGSEFNQLGEDDINAVLEKTFGTSSVQNQTDDDDLDPLLLAALNDIEIENKTESTTTQASNSAFPVPNTAHAGSQEQIFIQQMVQLTASALLASVKKFKTNPESVEQQMKMLMKLQPSHNEKQLSEKEVLFPIFSDNGESKMVKIFIDKCDAQEIAFIRELGEQMVSSLDNPEALDGIRLEINTIAGKLVKEKKAVYLTDTSSSDEMIMPVISDNGQTTKMVKIFMNKCDDNDMEFIYDLQGVSSLKDQQAVITIALKMKTGIEKLVQEEKAIYLSDTTTNINAINITDKEKAERLELLTELGIKSEEIRLKIACHTEFEIAVQSGFLHVLGVLGREEEVIPAFIQEMFKKSSSNFMKEPNGTEQLFAIKKIISPKEFETLKQNYVTYLLKRLIP